MQTQAQRDSVRKAGRRSAQARTERVEEQRKREERQRAFRAAYGMFGLQGYETSVGGFIMEQRVGVNGVAKIVREVPAR